MARGLEAGIQATEVERQSPEGEEPVYREDLLFYLILGRGRGSDNEVFFLLVVPAVLSLARRNSEQKPGVEPLHQKQRVSGPGEQHTVPVEYI
jgi:hypothetical protein